MEDTFAFLNITMGDMSNRIRVKRAVCCCTSALPKIAESEMSNHMWYASDCHEHDEQPYWCVTYGMCLDLCVSTNNHQRLNNRAGVQFFVFIGT